MKTVFNTAEVAHVWAQQRQSEGRNSNRSLWFRDRTIYSYGTHYPLATFRTAKDCSRFVTLNVSGCSGTTSGHVGDVQRALRCPVFTIEKASDCQIESRADVERLYMGRVQKALKHAEKARTRRAEYLTDAGNLVRDANRLMALLGIPGEEFCISADWETEIKAARVTEAARLKARAEQHKKDAHAWLEAWRVHDEANGPQGLAWRAVYESLGTDFLRISKCGKFIETTRRAVVPVRAARTLWPLILEAQAANTRNNDIPRIFEHYHVNAIEANGDARIGCHCIKFSEFERMAHLLGLLDAKAQPAQAAPNASPIAIHAK